MLDILKNPNSLILRKLFKP